MKILKCLACKGELDVIGEDGFRKIVKCRSCNFTSGNVRRKEPEIVVIKKKTKKISDAVRELIVWRDSRALDWWGETLIFHIRDVLSRARPGDDDMPSQYDAGLVEFNNLTEDYQYQIIKEVLGITDEEIKKESGGW